MAMRLGVGPRTAIGQRKDGTVLFVVIDGRQSGYSLVLPCVMCKMYFRKRAHTLRLSLDGGSTLHCI